MATVNIAEEEQSLSALVERVQSGETVEIAKEGRVIAKLVPVEHERRSWKIDWDELARHRASSPRSTMTVEEMRRLDLL